MANKSWKAKLRKKEPPASATLTPEQLASRIGRMDQGEIWEDLKRRHGGKVPVPLIWDHLADRRETAIAGVSRVELARS